jgi:hypothetical protein
MIDRKPARLSGSGSGRFFGTRPMPPGRALWQSENFVRTKFFPDTLEKSGFKFPLEAVIWKSRTRIPGSSIPKFTLINSEIYDAMGYVDRHPPQPTMRGRCQSSTRENQTGPKPVRRRADGSGSEHTDVLSLHTQRPAPGRILLTGGLAFRGDHTWRSCLRDTSAR